MVVFVAKGLIKVLQCHKQAHLGGYYICISEPSFICHKVCIYSIE